MDSTKLKEINALQADRDLASTRHEDEIAHLVQISQTVLSATSSLIKYMEGHTSLVEVVNQIESIQTPDVEHVVRALNILDETIKARPQTDLSGVTQLMSELLNEAKQLPKTLPDAPVIPTPIDYSGQLNGLKDAIEAVQRVVEAQKLVVPAPEVNVPAPNVNVDAPDLKPLQDGFKDVVKAVKAIVIPEYKTDNEGVEKLLKDANKLLEKLLKKPVSAGGGGGGSSWPAVNNNDLPAPLKVDGAGNLRIAEAQLTTRYDIQSPIYYVGTAPVGTTDGTTGWTLTKYDLTSNPYTGKIATDVSWNNRASGTYQ